MRGINTNIPSVTDVGGDYFHTFTYMPLVPLATWIQPKQEKVTNVVWESSVRWFIPHSKTYNKEGDFSYWTEIIVIAYYCSDVISCNKIWADYFQSSLLLQKRMSWNIVSPYAHSQVCVSVYETRELFQWGFRSRCWSSWKPWKIYYSYLMRCYLCKCDRLKLRNKDKDSSSSTNKLQCVSQEVNTHTFPSLHPEAVINVSPKKCNPLSCCPIWPRSL